jgi:hypothetical protein
MAGLWTLPKKMTRLSNSELDTIEQEIGYPIPGLYRKLLIAEGYGTFGSREIYDPRIIPERSGCHFEEPTDLFGRYFPFGCNNATQELWIIWIEEKKAATIYHETNSNDYGDEGWQAYDDWIAEYFATNIVEFPEP